MGGERQNITFIMFWLVAGIRPAAAGAKERFMYRTLWPDVLSAGSMGVAQGEAVVATAFTHPTRGRVPCPAAPMLAGSLRGRGFTVRLADLAEAWDGAPGPGKRSQARAQTLSFVLRDGRTQGLCVVTAPGLQNEEPAARLMAEWSAALRTRVLMAVPGPTSCAGAETALRTLIGAQMEAVDQVYVLGDVPGARGGAVPVASVREVPEGARLLIGAAGAGPLVRDQAASRGLRVVDATCPLVKAVHQEVRRFVAQGDQVVLVGAAGHAAVAGLVDQAPDSVLLVQDAAQAATVEVRDPGRVAVVLQPGLPVEDGAAVAEVVRTRFGHVIPQHPSTYCYAASDQRAARASLIAACNVVLIIAARSQPLGLDLEQGGQGSEAKVYRVHGPGDVRPEWLAGAGTVGVCAEDGAEPGSVDALLDALAGLGPHTVVRRTGISSVPGAADTVREPALTH